MKYIVHLTFSLFFALCTLTAAFAQGDAPTMIKGQEASSKSVGATILVPAKLATKVSSSQTLLELGNKNLLVNPGFEHSIPSTGWTLVACTGTATSSLTSGTASGYPGENQYGIFTVAGGASGGTCSIKQEVTTLAGSQGFISALLASQIGIPASSLTAYTLVNGTRTTTHDFTNTGTTFFWDETFAYAEVSTGTSLGLEIVITAPASTSLSAYIDRAEISLGKVTKSAPLITKWVQYTPTFAGFGTVTCSNCMEWRQVGQSIEIRGKFVSGTSTATEARMTLPNSYTSSTPSLQKVGHGNRSGGTGKPSVLAGAGLQYLNFGAGGVADDTVAANGSSVVGAGETTGVWASVPIANLQNSTNILEQNCGARCVDTFSAFVTDGSATTTVSNENADWISGNCTNPSAGTYTCTVNSGFITSAMNCSATSHNQNSIQRISWSGATSFTVSSLSRADAVTWTDNDFMIICQKTGADYTATRTLVASLKEVVTAPGITKPVQYSATFAGASTSTTCGSSPCTKYDETSSVFGAALTRSATGVYSLTTGNAFAPNTRVRCRVENYNSATSWRFNVGALTSNSSGALAATQIQTYNSISDAAADSVLDITCEGQAP